MKIEIKNYEKQMYEFIDELNKIGTTGDRRYMILFFGIYSEYLINELLRVRLPKVNFLDINSQSLKLKILLSHSILSDKTYEVLQKLNQVRNEYAHNLMFDSGKINKWAKETPLNWNVEGGEESLKKIEEELSKNLLDRFEKICLSNIIFLFQNLGGFPKKDNPKKIGE